VAVDANHEVMWSGEGKYRATHSFPWHKTITVVNFTPPALYREGNNHLLPSSSPRVCGCL